MLWHIELKFCIWLWCTVLQIKFECRQFASIFVGVMPLLELKLLEIQFSALFSYMLWHIELKFCTWLFSNVLQIKFECRQFVSIFVWVMPLLELKILQIHSFPNFSLTCFDILSWNFAYDFVSLYYRSSSSVVNFCVSYAPFGTQITENIQFSALFSDMLWLIELQICTWLCFTEIKINFDCRQFASMFCGSYAPFGTQNTENIQFSALFSDMRWLIELQICTWLCFTEIKINFDCRQFASIFCGSYAPFGTLNTWNTQFTFLLHALAYWAEIFHVTFFNVLQIKFECCHSVSIHFIRNLKFDVGFFNAFLLEKYSIKIAF